MPERISSEIARSWGEQTLEQIRDDFWLEDQQLYAEQAGRRGRWRARRPAFMWSAGIQLTALTAATANNPKFEPQLHTYAAALKRYWHVHNGIGGYDVQPVPKPVDRYYDDNAWIVLALVEAYELTGQKRYLDDASATFDFVMSGEDEELGGGIYWRENELESKNTCSNAPAMVGALRLYEATGEADYLRAAKRLYAWTCTNLQDDDGLFLDNRMLDGRIDRRKFSYNSAVMIRANCLLYKIVGDAHYLDEAQRIARAAQTKWVDDETGAMHDTGKFAHMLLEAFLAVHECDGDPQWLDTTAKCIRYLKSDLAGASGRYPGRWDRPATDNLRRYQLIDQASVARAYFVVAKALAAPEEQAD